MMRKLIKVTKKHIALGVPCSETNCPVALALRDAGVENAFVESTHIYLDGFLKLSKSVETPRSVKRFVIKFDISPTRKSAKPFNFFLRLS